MMCWTTAQCGEVSERWFGLANLHNYVVVILLRFSMLLHGSACDHGAAVSHRSLEHGECGANGLWLYFFGRQALHKTLVVMVNWQADTLVLLLLPLLYCRQGHDQHTLRHSCGSAGW